MKSNKIPSATRFPLSKNDGLPISQLDVSNYKDVLLLPLAGLYIYIYISKYNFFFFFLIQCLFL